jgi:quercetin dioxygenase-like cupin family protein
MLDTTIKQTGNTQKREIVNPIIKDKVTFIQTAADTNGKLTWFSVDLAPNGGNDLHYHDTFAETFIAVEGSLGITLEQEELLLQPGESITIPIGALHRFYNPNDFPIKFETKVKPASKNLEEFIQIIYGLARDGKTNSKSIPKSITNIGLLSLIGETLPPPKSLLHRLTLVFKWIGKRAEKNGKLEELRAKYVKY